MPEKHLILVNNRSGEERRVKFIAKNQTSYVVREYCKNGKILMPLPIYFPKNQWRMI